jgi:hypothetical protein
MLTYAAQVELSDVPIKSLVPDALANWKPKEGEVYY